MSLDALWSTLTLELVISLVMRQATPSRNPLRVTPFPVGGVCKEEGDTGRGARRVSPPTQGENNVGRGGYPTKGMSPREEAQAHGGGRAPGGCVRGGACPQGEGRVRKGRGSPMLTTFFSPGLHSALLTSVQVPDILGRVNKELKFRQR